MKRNTRAVRSGRRPADKTLEGRSPAAQSTAGERAGTLPAELKSARAALRRGIAARRRLAEEREGCEPLHRELLQNLNVGVYRSAIAADGRFLQANPAAARMFGFPSVASLLKTRVVDRYDDPADRREFIDTLLAQGFIKDRVVKARRRDGTTFWVSTTARLQRDRSGVPLYVDGVVEDVNERTAFDEAIRESETRFRQLAENIREVFWITDVAKTQMLYVSPSYEEIWGRPKSELYASARSWLDAIHAEDRNRVERAALSQQASAQYDVEYRIARPDGTQRWIRDRAFPVRDAAGQVYRLVGVAEDITQQKAAEQRVLDQQMRLADVASQLAMTEERERRSIARALHDGIGQILATCDLQLGVFHKATTPQRREKALRDLRELIATAIRETRSLTYELAPPHLQALGLGEGLRELCATMARRNGLRIDCACTLDDQPIPDGISGVLFAAARELILNVVKHAHATSALVRCQATPNELTLRVSDNGRGIDNPSIGFRYSAESGFGLFTLRERATNLGGTLEIESRPRNGSTITLRIPVTLRPVTYSGEGSHP